MQGAQTMTVKELIAKLQDVDGDLLVLQVDSGGWSTLLEGVQVVEARRLDVQGEAGRIDGRALVCAVGGV